jgi:LmbE family N-acetylglucosaminyl deacetylase
MLEVRAIASEKNLIFLSPHYDDVALTWGGYLDSLRRTDLLQAKRVKVIHVFSRSIYQVRDHAGNRDLSDARIQYATGIRLIEDLNCLDDLLGQGRYAYEILGERECILRAREWKKGEEFEFPQGTQATFNAEEKEIFARLKAGFLDLLRQQDSAVFVPLCIKEHIDHVMVRDAVIESVEKLGTGCRARIYFGEDQPYAGLASKEDWATAQALIDALKLEALDYPVEMKTKVDRVMKFYPSQVEESYRKGLLQRSQQLDGGRSDGAGMERIYRWNRP